MLKDTEQNNLRYINQCAEDIVSGLREVEEALADKCDSGDSDSCVARKRETAIFMLMVTHSYAMRAGRQLMLLLDSLEESGKPVQITPLLTRFRQTVPLS